jgi:hypothetical protein
MAKAYVALQLDEHHKIKYSCQPAWNAYQLFWRREWLHNAEILRRCATRQGECKVRAVAADVSRQEAVNGLWM